MSIGYKKLIVAGVIITAAVAVASIALLMSKPSPPDAASQAPAPEADVGKLSWLETPRAVPPTVFMDETGASRTLGDFAGRVLVVNLWATWCAPCVREMPTLDALQEILGGDRFAVVAVSQDHGGTEVAKPFMAAKGWQHLALYTDPKAGLAKDTGVAGLPTSLIVDRHGQEVARLEGGAVWNSPAMIETLRKLMDQP